MSAAVHPPRLKALEGAPKFTFVICSNRPHLVARYLGNSIEVADSADRFIVVFDCELDAYATDLAARLEARGLVVLRNGRNRGLSFSRNRALASCSTRYALFLDDDIEIDRAVLHELRTACGDGEQIVGARIRAGDSVSLAPWLWGPGQLHYIGVHRDDGPASIWGGCMAVDVAFARANGIEFRRDLGRQGRGLRCAEDTSFVRNVAVAGGTTRALHDAWAFHHLDNGRLRPHYVLRRAYWQGRSEVARGEPWAGLRKELGRNLVVARRGLALRECALGLVCVAAVAVGIVSELVRRAL